MNRYLSELILAVSQKDSAQVRRLIPLGDPKDNDSQALRAAAAGGNIACVSLLIPVSDWWSTQNVPAVQRALNRGHVECARLLMQSAPEGINLAGVLERTAEIGSSEGVQMLLEFVDPKANNSAALMAAILNEQHGCIDLLYGVSDPLVVLHQLQQKWPNDHQCWLGLERRIAQEQHAVLLKCVAEEGTPRAERKL